MRFKTITLGIVMGALLLLLSAEVLVGQPKRKRIARRPHPARVVKKRHAVHRRARPKLPAKHVKVVVGPHSYWHSHGVFYRNDPKGYVVVRGPIGARIRTLPRGHRVVVIGGVTYYHYYGTYYGYEPDEKEYVVVEAPEEQVYADVVHLVDGETLEGTFMGGSEESIEFEVDGEVQEIPLVDIVSISFEPPSESEDEGE